jgi:hypothetical protein
MGQYHYLVNFDKKQCIHPHQIGNGLKLAEQICSRPAAARAGVAAATSVPPTR